MGTKNVPHTDKDFGYCHLYITYITILKLLGYFNPILGQIWTNPAVGLNL